MIFSPIALFLFLFGAHIYFFFYSYVMCSVFVAIEFHSVGFIWMTQAVTLADFEGDICDNFA